MDASPLLPLLREKGARIGPRPECPARESALDFGDPRAEHRAAREGCALLDQTDRDRVTARGADAADFLHRITANDVRQLVPGAGQRNLLLTPKGRVRFDLRLERDDEALRLSTEPGQGPALRDALETYRFSEDVALEATGGEHAPLDLLGPEAERLLERVLGEPVGLEPDHHRRVGADLQVARLNTAGVPALRIDAGPGGVLELWKELVEAGATPAGLAAREALRVEHGCALHGVDFDERTYPQEAGLEDGFSLAKGCYVGQEVVAKLDTYGGMNRALVRLAVEGTLAGDDEGRRLFDEPNREVGRITTIALSPRHEGVLALALVKVGRHEPGTRLAHAGGHATVL